MTRETRRLVGIILVLVPAAAFGRVSLLSRSSATSRATSTTRCAKDLWRAGHGIPVAAATEPSVLIALVPVGGLLLVGGVASLGIGLLRPVERVGDRLGVVPHAIMLDIDEALRLHLAM